MTQNRFHSIDLFRGLAILGMVLANYLAGVNWISPWFKHAPDAGYTVIDLVAPMFIFAIGLTYGRSFNHRLERDGAGLTYQHFITRFPEKEGARRVLRLLRNRLIDLSGDFAQHSQIQIDFEAQKGQFLCRRSDTTGNRQIDRRDDIVPFGVSIGFAA